MNNLKTVSIQYNPTQEEIEGGKKMTAGKFLWPGFKHTYTYYGKEIYGGKYRYQTGLEEDQVESDRVAEVAEAKAKLEKTFGPGTLDATNETFWKERAIVITRQTTHLNLNDPDHLLQYYAIKAGAIYEIASSYEVAKNSPVEKRWYLVEPDTQAEIVVSNDRIINKAIAALEAIDEDGTKDDMFLVHKILISSDRGATKQTPQSTLYKDLSDFIHGKIVKTEKKKTPKQFVEVAKLLEKDKKKLYITAYVKDANYFNFLTVAQDGSFENIETRAKYGTTIENAVAYLSNPANQDELENIRTKVEKKWSE